MLEEEEWPSLCAPVFHIPVSASLNHHFYKVIVLKYRNWKRNYGMLAGWQLQQREATFPTPWKHVYPWKFLLSFLVILPCLLSTYFCISGVPALTFSSLSPLWLTVKTSPLVCSIPLYSSSKSGADLHLYLAERCLVSLCHAYKTSASRGKMLLCLTHCPCEVFSVNRQNQILCLLRLSSNVLHFSLSHFWCVIALRWSPVGCVSTYQQQRRNLGSENTFWGGILPDAGPHPDISKASPDSEWPVSP